MVISLFLLRIVFDREQTSSHLYFYFPVVLPMPSPVILLSEKYFQCPSLGSFAASCSYFLSHITPDCIERFSLAFCFSVEGIVKNEYCFAEMSDFFNYKNNHKFKFVVKCIVSRGINEWPISYRVGAFELLRP